MLRVVQAVYEPGALTIFAFALLVGAPALSTLVGILYWLFSADLNVEMLMKVGRKLIAEGDAKRLLKIARTDPKAPLLGVIERALTLHPGSLRAPEAPGGYRDDRPVDRHAQVCVALRDHGRALSFKGRALWWGGAAGVLPTVGVFAVMGPWSPWYAPALWWTAVGALAAFALLTYVRARVERKIETLVEFMAPHAGAAAS